MKLVFTKGDRRTLDFDIENMPLTYYAPDYPTAYITAIAWAFTDTPKDIQVRVITNPAADEEYDVMLYDFLEAYDEAELVTGHYIRKHDLPIINGALLERGFLKGLSQKMVSDTKTDLKRYTALPKNQEFLEAVFGTATQKYQMTQADWRLANRFTEKGIGRTKKRVTSDVKGHMQTRKELIERGLLHPPKLWRP